MTKASVVQALQKVLQQKWEEANASFQNTKAGATSGESRQEGKYDTRAIEESYLAHGLAQSVQEYQQALHDLQACAALPSQSQVQLGSLLHCQRGTEETFFFLSQSGGGTQALVADCEVTIITAQSPLGRELIGRTPPYSSEQMGLKLTAVS